MKKPTHETPRSGAQACAPEGNNEPPETPALCFPSPAHGTAASAAAKERAARPGHPACPKPSGYPSQSWLVHHPHALALPGGGIDLGATLHCGQSFSWQGQGGVYSACIDGRAVYAGQLDGSLYLLSADEKAFTISDTRFWRHYFGLDMDYSTLLARFCQNPALNACVEYNPGLRLLNQPFFETLISFIFSQNNNIPRITALSRRLCEHFGEEQPGGLHSFPSCALLAEKTAEDLSCLRAGYRVKYALDAAKRMAAGQLCEEMLRQAGLARARAGLMEIQGVGPKVADCVLLYGLGYLAALPMDVWMIRALGQLFGGEMPQEAHGYEGIAQLFIFNYARNHLSPEGPHES